MKADVGGSQERDKDERLQVAPIAADHDLAGHEQQEARKKQTVEHHSRPRPCQSGDKKRDTRRAPEEKQENESPAGHRQTPGPIGDRGQQKTGHDSRTVPEDHLVGVPRESAVPFGQTPQSCERPDPKGHGDDGPNARAEEERPETIAEKRNEAVVGCASAGSARFRLEAALHHLAFPEIWLALG